MYLGENYLAKIVALLVLVSCLLSCRQNTSSTKPTEVSMAYDPENYIFAEVIDEGPTHVALSTDGYKSYHALKKTGNKVISGICLTANDRHELKVYDHSSLKLPDLIRLDPEDRVVGQEEKDDRNFKFERHQVEENSRIVALGDLPIIYTEEIEGDCSDFRVNLEYVKSNEGHLSVNVEIVRQDINPPLR